MATIPAGEAGNELFLQAAGWWSDHNPGVFQGTPYPDKLERKIYDETTNPNPPPGLLYADVTPSQAVLEAALDSALAAIAQQQEIDEARAAIIQIRQYRVQQLVKAAPDTPAQQVADIKDIANGNIYLTRIMTNKITEKNSALGWTLTLNPTTAQTRNQFLETIDTILGIPQQS